MESNTLFESPTNAPGETSKMASRFLLARESSVDDEADGPGLAMDLLADAVDCRTTDIHIDPCGDYYRIRFRIDGLLANVVAGEVAEGRRLINQFRVLSKVDPSQVDQTESRWSGEVNQRSLSIRCTAVSTILGDKLCVRLLGGEIPKPKLSALVTREEDLSEIQKWLDSPNGMVVVVGPTGSGKSTLMYGMAEELSSSATSVITLEDPVERDSSEMTQLRIGSGTSDLDLADAVQVSLRLDPDYLVLGEIRGENTAKASIRSTQSGRPLMTSMHGEDLASVINNFRTWNVDDREIAATLRLVVATRLVRRLCDQCKTTRALSDADRAWLSDRVDDNLNESVHPVGCNACNETGYRSRLGVHRIWRLTSEDLGQIREGVAAEAIAPRDNEFVSVGVQAVREGQTTVAELRRVAMPHPA